MPRECRERFPRPPRVIDPDMHQGTSMPHVPWCIPGSLTSGFLWSRRRGKRSRHSRGMRNPKYHVSGKRPISRASESQRHLSQSTRMASMLTIGLHPSVENGLAPAERYNTLITTVDRSEREGTSLDCLGYPVCIMLIRIKTHKNMMTSLNGDIFRVTGLFSGEFTGPRWIPLKKASDAEFWCFL